MMTIEEQTPLPLWSWAGHVIQILILSGILIVKPTLALQWNSRPGSIWHTQDCLVSIQRDGELILTDVLDH